jgi:hypothetical protein
MSIQLLDYQGSQFLIDINGIRHRWWGLNLWRGNSMIPLKLSAKGTTVGWYTAGVFISYKQIKKHYEHYRNETAL